MAREAKKDPNELTRNNGERNCKSIDISDSRLIYQLRS